MNWICSGIKKTKQELSILEFTFAIHLQFIFLVSHSGFLQMLLPHLLSIGSLSPDPAHLDLQALEAVQHA